MNNMKLLGLTAGVGSLILAGSAAADFQGISWTSSSSDYGTSYLIYADVGGGNKCYEKMMKDDIEEGVIKILDNGFINNNLGILVFLYFDGIGIEPFLDKQYGEYKSKDFFSSNIVWDDGYGIGDQRLDCVVFFL